MPLKRARATSSGKNADTSRHVEDAEFVGVFETEWTDCGPGQAANSLPIHKQVQVRCYTWIGHLPEVSFTFHRRFLPGLNDKFQIEGRQETKERIESRPGISLLDLGNGVLFHPNAMTDSLL